ncbi:MAG: sensor domain-containing diguanylate cyclase [Acidobacteriota bacterium]
MIRRALISEVKIEPGDFIAPAEVQAFDFEVLSPADVPAQPEFQRLKYGMVFWDITDASDVSAAQVTQWFPAAALYAVSRCYEGDQERRAALSGFQDHFFLPLSPLLLGELSEEASRLRLFSRGHHAGGERSLMHLREMNDLLESISVTKDYAALARKAYRFMLTRIPAKYWGIYSRSDKAASWRLEFSSESGAEPPLESWTPVLSRCSDDQDLQLGDHGAFNTPLAGVSRGDFLCYPIDQDGEPVGVLLGVGCLRPGGFVPEDRLVLDAVSHYLASAWRCIELVRENERLSFTDSLTGLYNYRYLRQFLSDEIKRSSRYHRNFALMFIDIDWFKRVNDTHGHLVGSEVLTEIAQVFRHAVRDSDVIVRYGGDEYVIILTETSRDGASVIADRLLRTVEDSSFSQHRGLGLKLTVSVGLASYPDHGSSVDDLIRRADQAMYEAKGFSKNCVKTAS